MLHLMERKGYRTSHEEYQGSTRGRLYRATDLGRKGLAVAKRQLRELTGEAMNDETLLQESDRCVIFRRRLHGISEADSTTRVGYNE
jgi:DNA-binding PadR family transcriptional regulator